MSKVVTVQDMLKFQRAGKEPGLEQEQLAAAGLTDVQGVVDALPEAVRSRLNEAAAKAGARILQLEARVDELERENEALRERAGEDAGSAQEAIETETPEAEGGARGRRRR